MRIRSLSLRRILRPATRKLGRSVAVLAVALFVLALLFGPWLVGHMFGPVAWWFVEIATRVFRNLFDFGRWLIELVF